MGNSYNTCGITGVAIEDDEPLRFALIVESAYTERPFVNVYSQYQLLTPFFEAKSDYKGFIQPKSIKPKADWNFALKIVQPELFHHSEDEKKKFGKKQEELFYHVHCGHVFFDKCGHARKRQVHAYTVHERAYQWLMAQATQRKFRPLDREKYVASAKLYLRHFMNQRRDPHDRDLIGGLDQPFDGYHLGCMNELGLFEHEPAPQNIVDQFADSAFFVDSLSYVRKALLPTPSVHYDEGDMNGGLAGLLDLAQTLVKEQEYDPDAD